MKNRIAVLFLALAVLAVPAYSQKAPAKRSMKSHALAKVASAVAPVVVKAPKATLVALKDTLGAVLFSAESVVDVVHVGTSALNAAASKELKKNPFEYVDEYVGKADTGLEKAYLFFFRAQI